MQDGSILISAIIGVSGAAIGALIGALSAHFLYYKNKKSEEQKIINESIHFLLEVFFLINRLNTEKMMDIYLNYYFQKISALVPAIDEKTVESIKEQYSPMIKGSLPALQKQTFEDLKKLNSQYEKMVTNLATILPVNAYYLRGKNNLENLMQTISEYFENVKVASIENTNIIDDMIKQMQSSLTTDLINEYKDELKSELLVLLRKTSWSNCCAGKKAIEGIESFVLTENEKRKVDKEIVNIVNLVVRGVAGCPR